VATRTTSTSCTTTDTTVPPTYKTNTFDGTHTHYLTSGAVLIDSGDLDQMANHLRHHGYSAANGVKLILLCNNQEGIQIRKFKAGVVNNNAAVASYDFIPAQGSAPFLLPGAGLVGVQPGQEVAGMTTIGQYGDMVIVEEDYIPAGYVLLVGTGGRANLNNPVGLREHVNPGLRGFRLVKGPDANYPLTDSAYQRGIGTGIRQRGGAVVMQVTASGTYAIPTIYV
jgi:hypothetical protein